MVSSIRPEYRIEVNFYSLLKLESLRFGLQVTDYLLS